MGLEDVVNRMKKVGRGAVQSSNLPDASTNYKVVGTLNLQYELADSFIIDSLDKPLFSRVMYSNYLLDGAEFLECSPMGDEERSTETILIPHLTDGFGVGSVRVGRKMQQVPYGANVVTYKKYPNSVIHYMGRSSVAERGRTYFAVIIKVSAPAELAEEFMGLAQMRPNDVWKLLSDGLFPGVFSTEQGFYYNRGSPSATKIMALPVPVERTGKMYFRDLSPQQLETAGFKFGTSYLSKDDRTYRTVSSMQHAFKTNDGRRLHRLQTQHPEHYALFEGLQKKGIEPEPLLHAEVSVKRHISPTLLVYTLS